MTSGPWVATRVDALDWSALTERLDESGSVQTPQLLAADECRSLSALYGETGLFRSGTPAHPRPGLPRRRLPPPR
ncbi:MAG TPA: hypothetical protein VFD41_07655 [Actinomycetales bacterium]|nr:hypothetical protein [Actinomycetales bacterium]